MPGFGELMRAVSLQHVPTAILSRQTAVIRKKALIVNLPGKPKSIRECLDAVMPAIPYCIDLIGGPFLTTREERLVAALGRLGKPEMEAVEGTASGAERAQRAWAARLLRYLDTHVR